MSLFVKAMRVVTLAGVIFTLGAVSFAESHPTGVPELASRPGAAYTLYIDFAGFNYNGTWAGKTPGNVPAYLGVTTSYNATQQAAMKNIWVRIAEKYSAFNINVTTIDPAVAAGQAATDAQRQAYYDNTAKIMHTIASGSNAWYSTKAGGVSYVGVTQYAYPNTGYHTNWVFADTSPSNYQFIGEAVAHENGHGLSLYHQSDYNGNSLINEYSTNYNSTGNGSFAPVMGVTYYSQRGLWRQGYSSNGHTYQNDIADLLENNGMGGLIDDGIGHSFDSATILALNGSKVDFNLAEGIITPNSSSNPNPMGAENYTSDFFLFRTLGGSVTLTANDGSDWITPGVADPGAMLDATLTIYDANRNVVATGVRSSDTLKTTFSGVLAAGNYYAKVGSYGGYTSANDSTAHYYTMGSYFLTGTGFTAVPEPATLVGLALGAVALLRRRKRQ